MYVTDNNNRYPHFREVRTSLDVLGFCWEHALEPYQVSWTNSAYHCPGYKGPISLGVAGTPWRLAVAGSYAYNYVGTTSYSPIPEFVSTQDFWLGLGYIYDSFVGDPRFRLPAISQSQVRMPAEMFAIGESRLVNQTGSGLNALAGDDSMIIGHIREGVLLFPPRHGKRYNQLCCDGHVEPITPSVLFDGTKSATRWNNDHQPHPETWQ